MYLCIRIHIVHIDVRIQLWHAYRSAAFHWGLQKFQAHAAWHFASWHSSHSLRCLNKVWSLADVFICAFVLPSIFWPIRWPLHWRAVTMETMEQKEFLYETRRRMELLSAASAPQTADVKQMSGLDAYYWHISLSTTYSLRFQNSLSSHTRLTAI